MGGPCPCVSKKVWHFYQSKSLGIWDGIVNPIYGCWVKITPDINPLYGELGRSFPSDSKNVSFVDIGLV